MPWSHVSFGHSGLFSLGNNSGQNWEPNSSSRYMVIVNKRIAHSKTKPKPKQDKSSQDRRQAARTNLQGVLWRPNT